MIYCTEDHYPISGLYIGLLQNYRHMLFVLLIMAHRTWVSKTPGKNMKLSYKIL